MFMLDRNGRTYTFNPNIDAKYDPSNKLSVAALVLSEQNAPDTILMEQVLVDVRVREAEMRRKGHNTIADTYIEAFIATLDSVNPSLNQLISAEK